MYRTVILALLIASNAEASVQYLGTSAPVTSATGTTIVLTMPTDTIVDDLMVAVICAKHNLDFTPPAGWNVVTETNNGLTNRFSVYYKKAVGGEAGPYTFTQTTSTLVRIGFISTFRGVDTTTALGGTSTVSANVAATTITGATYTPAVTNEMIVFTGCHSDDSTAAAPGIVAIGSGTDPTWDEAKEAKTATGTQAIVVLQFGPRSVSTATGARTMAITGSTSVVNTGVILGLRPATNPTFGYLQRSPRGIGSGVTSQGTTFLTAPAAGNLIVCGYSCYIGGSGCTVSGFTDNAGNGTYTLTNEAAPDVSTKVGMRYKGNIASTASFTVTITSSAAADLDISCSEVVGADTTTPIDANNSATGSSTTPTVSVTAVSSDTIMFGAFAHSGTDTEQSNGVGDNGFLLTTKHESGTSGMPFHMENQTYTSAGAKTVDGVLAASNSWAIVGASFKKASAGGGGGTKKKLTLLGIGFVVLLGGRKWKN